MNSRQAFVTFFLVLFFGATSDANDKLKAVTFSFTNVGQVLTTGDTIKGYNADAATGKDSEFQSYSLGLISPIDLSPVFPKSDFFMEISLRYERFKAKNTGVEIRKSGVETGLLPVAAELAIRYPINKYLDVGILCYVYTLEISNSSMDRKYKDATMEYGIPITILYPIEDKLKLGLAARITSELSFDSKKNIQQQNELLFKFEYWL